MHILVAMNEVLANARADVSIHAPTYATIQLYPENRDVIGKGGATIRAIVKKRKRLSTLKITVLSVFMAKPKVLRSTRENTSNYC